MRRDVKPSDPSKFLAKYLTEARAGHTRERYRSRQTIFSQGDPADSLFHIEEGRVALGVISKHGKEAVISILGTSDFFGEGCLAGQELRTFTAISMTSSSLLRVEKDVMWSALRAQPDLSEYFISYLLARNARMQDDLADQLFHPSEKRLARVLVSLGRQGNGSEAEPIIPKISQQVLADMIGTTRSRVSHFMNNFKKLGLIDYNGELKVNIPLLKAFLKD